MARHRLADRPLAGAVERQHHEGATGEVGAEGERAAQELADIVGRAPHQVGDQLRPRAGGLVQVVGACQQGEADRGGRPLDRETVDRIDRRLDGEDVEAPPDAAADAHGRPAARRLGRRELRAGVLAGLAAVGRAGVRAPAGHDLRDLTAAAVLDHLVRGVLEHDRIVDELRQLVHDMGDVAAAQEDAR